MSMDELDSNDDYGLDGSYETIHCSNGWIEVRDEDNPDDYWIATDSPVSIDP